jgi:hypothetical protein
MGRCVRCGIDTGLGGGSYCKNEVAYKFGDTLKIKSGFYRGQTGRLIHTYDCGWKTTLDYEIELEDSTKIAYLDERDVELIKDDDR